MWMFPECCRGLNTSADRMKIRSAATTEFYSTSALELPSTAWNRLGLAMDTSLRLAAPAAARLTIDLGALAGNWQRLAARGGEATATAAVVKADGYGVGLEPAAEVLAEAGCHTFFVALPDEGVRLRRTVRDAAIYVLNGIVPGSSDVLVANDLRPVLGSMPEVQEWAEVRQSGVDTGAALQVDTGMNRLGLTVLEARALAEDRDLLEAIRPSLLMSHLACAD